MCQTFSLPVFCLVTSKVKTHTFQIFFYIPELFRETVLISQTTSSCYRCKLNSAVWQVLRHISYLQKIIAYIIPPMFINNQQMHWFLAVYYIILFCRSYMFQHVCFIITELFRACWVTWESNAMVDKPLLYTLLCVCYAPICLVTLPSAYATAKEVYISLSSPSSTVTPASTATAVETELLSYSIHFHLLA
jgi:hypothetical protein